MGPIGAQEMIAVFVLALLLFGPKKLPELGRMLGKGLSEFRRAKSELKATFESHLNELEKETRAGTEITPALPTNTSSASYPYPYEDAHAYDETGYHASADAHALETHTVDEPHYQSPYADSTATAAVVHEASGDHAYSTSHPVVNGTVARSGESPSEAHQERPA